jgi:Domain of unknown function (DUF1905)/Bacteriocin-protection, YdeI or OmpD-Associated
MRKQSHKIRATLESSGKTATGIEIPAEVVDALGSGRKAPVRITIGGHTYRSTVATRGGRYLVGVSAETRALASVAAGDEVDAEIELDTAPREITVPGDLAAALDADAEVRRFFEGLSFSQKQWYVIPIEQAKRPFDRVVWLQTSVDGGLRYAAPSQVAVDCLSGNGRMPAEGEALLEWMLANESEWRADSLHSIPPMSSHGSLSPEYVEARRVLLDVLET